MVKFNYKSANLIFLQKLYFTEIRNTLIHTLLVQHEIKWGVKCESLVIEVVYEEIISSDRNSKKLL